MKIGIITFWDTQENYGQVLQCYALIKTLQNIGHNVFLIKTEQDKIKRSILHKFFTVLNYLTAIDKVKIINKPSRSHVHHPKNFKESNRQFETFKRKYIPSTCKVYKYEELLNHPLDCDAYICGSDQVWSTPSPLMFLEFVPTGRKKISYAASFGGYKIDNYLDRRLIKKYLKSFSYISVREEEGVILCKSLGIDAEYVLDPTLLLDEYYYRKLIKRNSSNNTSSYILLYLLGNEIDFNISELYDFAKSKKLEIKYVASQGRYDDYPKIAPTIEEWLELYINAKYIITNSFHGTVFSFIFKKKFLTIPLVGDYSRMNGRIYDLLGKYNLLDRIYKGKIDSIEECIDYSIFENIRKKEVLQTIEKLDFILNN